MGGGLESKSFLQGNCSVIKDMPELLFDKQLLGKCPRGIPEGAGM
jgi:hypothetical protein